MSHRHSFNTQPRKRMRQKDALKRWEERIKYCAKMVNDFDESCNWNHRSEIAHEQRDILKRKVG